LITEVRSMLGSSPSHAMSVCSYVSSGGALLDSYFAFLLKSGCAAFTRCPRRH